MRDILSKLDSINKGEVLEEGAKQDFRQMFANVPMDEETKKIAGNQFAWAYKTFRYDQGSYEQDENGQTNSEHILWWMRWVRLYVLYKLVNNLTARFKSGEIPKNSVESAERIRDTERRKMAKKFGTSEDGIERDALGIQSYQRQMEHYLSLGINKINGQPFGNYSANDLMGRFSRAEQDWQKKQRRNVEPEGTEKIMINFPEKNMAWFDLGRDFCSIEGNAMGHCGNTATPRPGDRLLSLRKIVQKKGKTYHVPQLTFVLDSDGELGEMKGFANEKPGEEFHDEIIALLRHPDVEGIKGGGYQPENNFNLNDLDPEVADELRSEKPGLRSMHDIIKKVGVTQEILDRIETKLNNGGFGTDLDTLKPVKEGNNDLNQPIIISTYRNVKDFAEAVWDQPLIELLNVWDDPDSAISDDFNIQFSDTQLAEMVSRLPEYIQKKLYAESGSNDPDRTVRILANSGHRYYEMMHEAFTTALNITGISAEDLSDHPDLFGYRDGEKPGRRRGANENFVSILEDRINEYLRRGYPFPSQYTWFEYDKDNFDNPVRVLEPLDHLIDVAEDNTFYEDTDSYYLQEYGWVSAHPDNFYEDRTSKYSHWLNDNDNGYGLLVDSRNEHDKWLAGLEREEFNVDLAAALDAFEGLFRLREAEEIDGELLDFKRLAAL